MPSTPEDYFQIWKYKARRCMFLIRQSKANHIYVHIWVKHIWVKTLARQHQIVKLSPTWSVISTFNTRSIRKIISVGRKNENLNMPSCIYNTDKEISFQTF